MKLRERMPKVILVHGRVRFSLCAHIFLFSQMLCLSSSVWIPNSYVMNYLLCQDLLLIDFYSCYVAISFFLDIFLVPAFAIWDFSASALQWLFPEPMASLAPQWAWVSDLVNTNTFSSQKASPE